MLRYICISPLIAAIILFAPSAFAQQMSGNYDVGGGNNDFPTIVAAVAALTANGMSGPVTINVYPGTYNGQSLIQNITGLGAQNPLVFRAAANERPVVTNPSTGTYDGNGFLIRGASASHVTIDGFEFGNCGYCGVQTYYGSSTSDSASSITIINNYFNQTSSYMMHTYYTRHAVIANNEFNAAGSYGFRLRYTTHSKIYNNICYGGSSYGAYIYNATSTEYYFNSFFASGSRTFYLGGTTSTGCTLKNNIFYNSGSGSNYAAYYYTNTNPISNYNCFWAPNGYVGYYGSACQTLVQFQAATGQDANSINVNPAFVSITAPYDLHISDTSLCIGAGTAIAGIEYDFEGDVRSPATPCIGADETAMVFNVELILEPLNPPIQIPANGGNFQYRARLYNHEPEAVNFDIWVMATLPSGSVYGPILGPLNITFGPNASYNGIRGQAVPAGAPAGDYFYDAYVGLYDTYIWHEDHFPFTKLTDGDGGNKVSDWYTWGDALEGPGYELMPVPAECGLISAYPNPFNPSTRLTFQLPQDGTASLAIYDIQGREVILLCDGWFTAGTHELTFDGTRLTSGVYFAVFKSAGVRNIQKLMLVK